MIQLKIFVLLALYSSLAQADFKANRDAVRTQCAEEAKTAGCEEAKVGKGLMKCLYKQKDENKDFKLSDSCRAALEEMRADRKELKEKRDN